MTIIIVMLYLMTFLDRQRFLVRGAKSLEAAAPSDHLLYQYARIHAFNQ